MSYHPPQAVHQPRELVYMDLVGPLTSIWSSYCYNLTAVDGYSYFLLTLPFRDCKADTEAAAIHLVMTAEMGFAGQVIADRGSDFTSIDPAPS